MKRRNALRAATGCVDLFSGSKAVLLMHKLSRFRRHPDWIAAFKRVVPQFMVKLPGGGNAVCERDIEMIFELTDEAFIDEIIRRGG